MLIKALLRTINNNNLSDLIFKLFIPIIFTIIIWTISNPGYSKLILGGNTDIPIVDSEIILAIKILFFLLFFLIITVLSIIDIQKARRRNKLFEEIIETCIQKIEDENKT